MLIAVTTGEDDAKRAFVDYIVDLAPSIEGIAGCRPIEGELGVTLLLDRDSAAPSRGEDDGESQARASGEGGARSEDEIGTPAHLGNLFLETRSGSEEEIEARCRHYLRSMTSAVQELPDWEGAQSRLFIAIRTLGYFHALGSTDVIARRSLPMLAECVVLDLGEALTYVTRGLAEKWGADPDVLFEVARANVEARLEHDLGPEGDDQPPRIYRLTSSDAYESSRLASLTWLAKAREALESEALVCAIPDRDTLLIAVDLSPPTLVRMGDLAERIYTESSRGISPALYVYTPDGELGPLELVDDHPLRERVRRGHLMLSDVEYGAQKIALDAELAEREASIFIASFFAVDRDGTVFSYATWAEGVEALLPQVDLMAFTFIDERPPLLVPFEVVAQLAGEHLEVVESLEPTRFHAKGFPDAQMLAQLAVYAVDA